MPLFEVDAQGRIVHANAEAERMFQRSREELAGFDRSKLCFRSVFAAGIWRIAPIMRLTRCGGRWAPGSIYSRLRKDGTRIRGRH